MAKYYSSVFADDLPMLDLPPQASTCSGGNSYDEITNCYKN